MCKAPTLLHRSTLGAPALLLAAAFDVVSRDARCSLASVPFWCRPSLTFDRASALVGHPVLAQQAPDLLRGDGDVDVTHAEVPQRVDDRVGDRRWRTDGGRLADALGPDGMVRR